jgi:hypothetical protein
MMRSDATAGMDLARAPNFAEMRASEELGPIYDRRTCRNPRREGVKQLPVCILHSLPYDRSPASPLFVRFVRD